MVTSLVDDNFNAIMTDGPIVGETFVCLLFVNGLFGQSFRFFSMHYSAIKWLRKKNYPKCIGTRIFKYQKKELLSLKSNDYDNGPLMSIFIWWKIIFFFPDAPLKILSKHIKPDVLTGYRIQNPAFHSPSRSVCLFFKIPIWSSTSCW